MTKTHWTFLIAPLISFVIFTIYVVISIITDSFLFGMDWIYIITNGISLCTIIVFIIRFFKQINLKNFGLLMLPFMIIGATIILWITTIAILIGDALSHF